MFNILDGENTIRSFRNITFNKNVKLIEGSKNDFKEAQLFNYEDNLEKINKIKEEPLINDIKADKIEEKNIVTEKEKNKEIQPTKKKPPIHVFEKFKKPCKALEDFLQGIAFIDLDALSINLYHNASLIKSLRATSKENDEFFSTNKMKCWKTGYTFEKISKKNFIIKQPNGGTWGEFVYLCLKYQHVCDIMKFINESNYALSNDKLKLLSKKISDVSNGKKLSLNAEAFNLIINGKRVLNPILIPLVLPVASLILGGGSLILGLLTQDSPKAEVINKVDIVVTPDEKTTKIQERDVLLLMELENFYYNVLNTAELIRKFSQIETNNKCLKGEDKDILAWLNQNHNLEVYAKYGNFGDDNDEEKGNSEEYYSLADQTEIDDEEDENLPVDFMTTPSTIQCDKDDFKVSSFVTKIITKKEIIVIKKKVRPRSKTQNYINSLMDADEFVIIPEDWVRNILYIPNITTQDIFQRVVNWDSNLLNDLSNPNNNVFNYDKRWCINRNNLMHAICVINSNANQFHMNMDLVIYNLRFWSIIAPLKSQKGKPPTREMILTCIKNLIKYMRKLCRNFRNNRIKIYRLLSFLNTIMRRYRKNILKSDFEQFFPGYMGNKLDSLIVEMFKIFAETWIQQENGMQIDDVALHVLIQVDSDYNNFNLWGAGGVAQAEHISGLHPLFRISFNVISPETSNQESISELYENIGVSRANATIINEPTNLFATNEPNVKMINTQEIQTTQEIKEKPQSYEPSTYQTMNDVPLSGIAGIEELKREDIEQIPQRPRRFENLKNTEKNNEIAPTNAIANIRPASRYPEINPNQYLPQQIPSNPLRGVPFIPVTENYRLLKEMFKFSTVRDNADFQNLKSALQATSEFIAQNNGNTQILEDNMNLIQNEVLKNEIDKAFGNKNKKEPFKPIERPLYSSSNPNRASNTINWNAIDDCIQNQVNEERKANPPLNFEIAANRLVDPNGPGERIIQRDQGANEGLNPNAQARAINLEPLAMEIIANNNPNSWSQHDIDNEEFLNALGSFLQQPRLHIQLLIRRFSFAVQRIRPEASALADITNSILHFFANIMDDEEYRKKVLKVFLAALSSLGFILVSSWVIESIMPHQETLEKIDEIIKELMDEDPNTQVQVVEGVKPGGTAKRVSIYKNFEFEDDILYRPPRIQKGPEMEIERPAPLNNPESGRGNLRRFDNLYDLGSNGAPSAP